MPRDALNKEIHTGDLVVFTGTSYNRLKLGVLVRAATGATLYCLGSSPDGYMYLDRIGKTTSLVVIPDELITVDSCDTVDQYNVLKQTQMLLRVEGDKVFKKMQSLSMETIHTRNF